MTHEPHNSPAGQRAPAGHVSQAKCPSAPALDGDALDIPAFLRAGFDNVDDCADLDGQIAARAAAAQAAADFRAAHWDEAQS